MATSTAAGSVGSSHLPLRDVVATELRRLILDGTLRPGERLIEDRLAEPLGARLAAGHPGSAHIGRMKAILSEVQTTPERYDLDALSGLHTELHSLIFEMTGNGYLIAIAIPMVRRGQWLLRQSAPLRTPAAWSEHHWLIDAIEAGDPDLAAAAGRHHVLSVRNAMRRRQVDLPAR